MERPEDKERIAGSVFGSGNIKTEVENSVDNNDIEEDRRNTNGFHESNNGNVTTDRINDNLINNDGIASAADDFGGPCTTETTGHLSVNLETGCLSSKTNKIQQIVEDATRLFGFILA